MRKRCNRKVRDPASWIRQRYPIGSKQANDLGLAYHGALANMLSPHANQASWELLLCAYDVANLMCEMGVGADHLPTISSAQAIMHEIRAQADESGDWCINNDNMKPLLFDALRVHDEQCSVATLKQVTEALLTVDTVLRLC